MLITANCIDGPVEVDAHVFRDWAAHPGIRHDNSLRLDWWVVTHVPSGRGIVSAVGQLTEQEAVALASALGERVPVGIVPPLAPDDSVQVVPLTVRRLIRSVIFDVRGEVLQ